jgi:Xaa-Pro aminopeptidase
MKNVQGIFWILILLSGPLATAQTPQAEEFRNRRKILTGRMEPGSVMILRTPSMSGMFDESRPGGNFWYLTGINEPGCTLIIFSDDWKNPAINGNTHEILFIRPVNTDRINWDALTIGTEGARLKYGIEEARPAAEAGEFIGRLMALKPSAVYMDVERGSSLSAPLSADEQLIRSARDRGIDLRIISPSTILNPMLSQKSVSETELMRNVINVTAEAQREAARSLSPGMFEYQLDAVIKYVFSVNGSGSLAFPTIIGSGINSVVLHWMENSRRMESGDLVVVDCGAEKGMYTADITRTYPVSGRYTDRQKAIYEIVLKANEEAIKKIAPGVRLAELSRTADSVLADGMLRIGLINDRKEFRKYYYHGLSHQIGLKNAYGGLFDVLQPGMIITIEPGIYVREESLGIRIEDDVLVTENSYEVLSGKAPKRIPEIEQLMKEEGMDVNKKR